MVLDTGRDDFAVLHRMAFVDPQVQVEGQDPRRLVVVSHFEVSAMAWGLHDNGHVLSVRAPRSSLY
jgi:hypothetical protein